MHNLLEILILTLWKFTKLPVLRYLVICNVLHIWHIRVIPTYRVYRLYDIFMTMFEFWYIWHPIGMGAPGKWRDRNVTKPHRPHSWLNIIGDPHPAFVTKNTLIPWHSSFNRVAIWVKGLARQTISTYYLLSSPYLWKRFWSKGLYKCPEWLAMHNL